MNKMFVLFKRVFFYHYNSFLRYYDKFVENGYFYKAVMCKTYVCHSKNKNYISIFFNVSEKKICQNVFEHLIWYVKVFCKWTRSTQILLYYCLISYYFRFPFSLFKHDYFHVNFHRYSNKCTVFNSSNL